jgi:hypothetical protein
MLESGATGDAVRAIQRILAFLGYHGQRKRGSTIEFVPIKDDGEFGELTESAVLAFQAEHGLYADGKVGDTTLDALAKAFSLRQQELNVPGPAAGFAAAGATALPVTGILPFERVSCDKWGGGYDGMWLRADTAAAYRQVKAEANRQGAMITSSGGKRDLYASVGPNRSATSMHYTGRALDLFIYSAMQDPGADPYVTERLGDRRYRVWARCFQDRVAKQSDLPPKVTIDNVVTAAKRTKGVQVKDRFIDLTALFAAQGFRPIRARPQFESGGDYLGAEWWHFQFEDGLLPNVTNFGSDLLRAYPRTTIEPTPPWQFRDRVWQVNWF